MENAKSFGNLTKKMVTGAFCRTHPPCRAARTSAPDSPVRSRLRSFALLSNPPRLPHWPRHVMSPIPFLDPVPEGSRLRVKVQPRASRNEIGQPAGDALKVRVTAPPVDHAANEAVLELLARSLDVRRAAVQLVRGQTSRQKVILVSGLAPDEILARLGLE